MFQFQPFMALVLRSGGAHRRVKQEKHLKLLSLHLAFKSLIPLRSN